MHVIARGELGRDIGRYKEALMGNHGLQSLRIHYSSDLLTEEQFDLLCSTAPCLKKLVVYGGRGIARVPKQAASLVNLTNLRLPVLRIKQEDLCIVGGIPALLFCELYVLHAPDERLTISSLQFKCLKEFWYNNWFYGGGLEMLFLQEAMPELRRLHLTFRVQETKSKMGFVFSFEHLASLEHIDVTIRTEDASRRRAVAAEAAVIWRTRTICSTT
jgi:hypothetical protein